MVTVVAKIKAKSGEEAKLEGALRNVLPKVREEEGTLVYTLNRSQDDPSTLMVFEKYRDMDAFIYHSSTPYLKELFNIIMPLIDGTPSVELFDELA